MEAARTGRIATGSGSQLDQFVNRCSRAIAGLRQRLIEVCQRRLGAGRQRDPLVGAANRLRQRFQKLRHQRVRFFAKFFAKLVLTHRLSFLSGRVGVCVAASVMEAGFPYTLTGTCLQIKC